MIHAKGSLSKSGHMLKQRLAAIMSNAKNADSSQDTIHIVGVGGVLTSAYEQLRNAAEYTEEHLLLQKAIARFFRRVFVLHDHEQVARSGGELVTELTLAGYLHNDSVPVADVQIIAELADQYFAVYIELEKRRGVTQDQAYRWTIEVLASRVESMFSKHDNDLAFAEFAYEHALLVYPTPAADHSDAANHAASLYIAVHRTLLHADDAMIRSRLLERYGCSPTDRRAYEAFNAQLDSLLSSDATKKLSRLVDRDGAPLRIVRQMIADGKLTPAVFDDRSTCMNLATQQIESEYTHVEHRINRAIVKSVWFLFITKVLIGIALEVPYDMVAHGRVIWLPLTINLLFPPLFMLLLRYTLVLPSRANTAAVVDRIDALLYQHDKTLMLERSHYGERSRKTFRTVYSICAFAIVGLTVWGLSALQFSWLHIVIFFVFVSTASFLGFRLSRIVRELEVGAADQSAVSVMRDFVYMPFVVIGQWITRTYSQVNIIGTILDMVIELPLKTILRLIRQWSRFISERQDEL